MSEIQVSTVELARARAARIRSGIGAYLATLADVAAAYAQRDWIALGYESWESYVDGEYSEHRLRLSPEHRQKAVAELRLAGMSTRAIGSAVGISEATVRRDLSTASNDAVQPERITSLDGRERPATQPIKDHPFAAGETVHARPGEQDNDPRPAVEAESEFRGSDPAGVTAAGVAHSPADGAARTLNPHAAPAPAAPVHGAGAAGVTPHDPDRFAALLDHLVPDPNPHRAWQRSYLDAIVAAHRVVRFAPDEVAERADEQLLDELRRLIDSLADYRGRILRIREQSMPDNVRPIRRIS